MYPVGRILVADDIETGLLPGAKFKAGYILMPLNCGSAKKQHTIRSWLEQFGIPLEDEFYIQWNEMVTFVSPLMLKFEEAGASERAMDPIWSVIYHEVYAAYDTALDFMPQFKANMERLRSALDSLDKGLAEVGLLG